MMLFRKKLVLLSLSVTAVLVLTWALLHASSPEPVNKEAIGQSARRASNPSNKQLVDSGLHLLRTGDLVLRTGADITSYMFCQFNQTDKTYSHCGLVIIEHGYPFVYHSIGGENNPDQVLKRDSAAFWFSPATNLGFGIARYDLDSNQRSALTGTVRRFFRERRMFDMDFDLESDSRLYCAEFVYKALNQSVKRKGYLRPAKVFGYTFVGVDNLFLTPHARLVCQVRFK